MEFRFTWHNARVGAACWAPVGGYGWRPAIIEGLGRKYVHLVFQNGEPPFVDKPTSRGRREYHELRLRDPRLNGKDKPRHSEGLKMARFAIWGCGPAQSDLIRNADHSEDAYAQAQALDSLFVKSIGDEEYPADQVWFVEVDSDDETVDAATRHDPAVRMYCSL